MSTTEMMQRRHLRVREQLVEELDGGRFESALVKRILGTPTSFPHLLRACYYAEIQRYASARADLKVALAHAHASNTQSTVFELCAGLIATVTRDYGLALELLESAAREPKAAARAHLEALALTLALAWDEDARRVLAAATLLAPEDPTWEGVRAQLRKAPAGELPELREALDRVLAVYASGRAAEAAPLWQRMRVELAPGLLSDAARVLDVEIWLDEDGEDDRPEVPLATRVAVLERALELLGVLGYSFGKVQRGHSPRELGLHERDAKRLASAKRLLLDALARYSGPRRV